MSTHSQERQQLIDAFLYETQVQTAATVLLEHAIAEKLKLSVTDLHCANLARILGPLTAGRIAELTGFTTGAITGMLDRLERIGFVKRQTDPSDRRRVYVHAKADVMNRTIGPLYESLAAASLAWLETYSDEQLAFILDHMRRNSEIMTQEVTRMRQHKGQTKTDE